MTAALALSVLSALAFGIALVTVAAIGYLVSGRAG
jgi:hypothetical protein